ncbi:OmpP1/FadL family transporter [candidate division KSB1 bacterium]
MFKRILYIAAAAVILCGAFQEAGQAQSIFGSFGMGELRYTIHTRATGMGGAGLALKDPIQQNHVNPALMSDIANTSFGGGFWFEGINIKRGGSSQFLQNSVLSNFSFTIKVNEKFAFGGGLNPYFDTDYKLRTTTARYTNSVEAFGGTTSGYFGAAFRLNKYAAIGVNYVMLFGKDEETWKIDFVDPKFASSSNNYIRSKFGSGFSVGTLLSILPKLDVGGVFMSGVPITTTDRISYYSGRSATEDGYKIELPYSYGIGTVYMPFPELSFAADMYHWRLSELSAPQFPQNEYGNSSRFAVGMEFDPEEDMTSGFSERIIYRLGFNYWGLYSRDIDGSPVNEKFLSLGIGIPVMGGQARFDCAIEGGVRSSKSKLIGSETIIRFHIQFGGGERWF